MIPVKESRSEQLAQLLSFESRREQSAIARRSALYLQPRLEQFIEQVLAALMSSEAGKGMSPRVVLVHDTELDAYSFPDGGIYIHTGLLARLENAAELALLLAHELVHINRRHALQVLLFERKQADEPFAGRSLPDSLSWFQDPSSIQDRSGPSEALLNLRRSLEQEADALGLDMLVKANYDPNEALEIFEHLKNTRGTEENSERAGRMAERVPPATLDAPRQPTDRKCFAERLRPLLISQAELELQHGQWEAALGCARRLVRDDSADSSGHYLLGEIFRQRGEPGDEQRALTHYHLAIASDPFSRKTQKALGLIYLKQGQARRAQAFFRGVLDLSPQSPDNAYIHAYLTQCDILIEGGNP
jgi:predicted Zn-dependent protease